MSDDLSIPNTGYRNNRPNRYGTGQGRGQPGMDRDTRRLMIFAGGLGAVLLALIGASVVIGRHHGEVPVITADSRPVREKPVNPGGMKIDGAENDVFSGGSDTSNAKLAPRAENPDTKALQAAAVPLAAETPAVTEMAPLPAAPTITTPAITTPLAPVPTTRPAVVASASPIAKPVPVKPPVAAAESHSAGSTHQPMVQLAALTSEEAARHEWEQLSKRMPDLLKGHQPNYTRVERDGHTFWRVRTTGFADTAQARSFCDHVHAKGGGCSVADF